MTRVSQASQSLGIKKALYNAKKSSNLIFLVVAFVAGYFTAIGHGASSSLVSKLAADVLENSIISNEVTTEKQEETSESSAKDFELARTESFGFFDDIPSDQWNRLKKIVAHHKDHLVMDNPDVYQVGSKIREVGSGLIPQPWYQSHYEPNFSCMFKLRVGEKGGNGDGPKWMCDPHRLIRLSEERKKKNPNKSGCLVYSVGSCGDFSFESAFQNLLGIDTCEVHIFDMGDYAEKMPTGMNMYYHKWGFAHESYVDDNGLVFKTFKDTMQELGHEDVEAIDIFKIDCEGCEFETYLDWLDDSTPMFQQILVEIHTNKKGRTVNDMVKLFDALKKSGYVNFSKEHNIQLPNMSLSEFSFLKLANEFHNP